MAGDSWHRALAAPLIREMGAGRVDDKTLGRYFALESRFVETASRVRAAAILRAPSITAARGHYAALGSLLGEQGTVLARAIELLGAGGASAGDVGRGDGLARRVMEVAEQRPYDEILCCLLAAESLYEHWCRHASRSGTRQPILDEWIMLHTVAPFTDELAFLRDEFDTLPLTSERLTRLAALTGEILDLERDFHDSVRDPERA